MEIPHVVAAYQQVQRPASYESGATTVYRFDFVNSVLLDESLPQISISEFINHVSDLGRQQSKGAAMYGVNSPLLPAF
ncbi:MAG: hypothetical protein IPJ26_17205 [Bacteroidetes bacterium]|nr:hypothetical protein [Bacteroidota bacterium]